MAGIWADFPSGSHGLYGTDTSAMLDGVWAAEVVAPVNDPDPSIGSAGKVLAHACTNAGPGNAERMAIGSPGQDIGFAHRFWASALPSSSANFITFNSVTNEILYTLRLLSSGAMELYRGNGSDNVGTLIATTSSPIITANAWWHLEYFFNTATGEIEVRRNGVTIDDLTLTDGSPPVGIDSGIFSLIGFPNKNNIIGAGATFRSKDIVVWDTSGSQVNDFQGSVSVFFNPAVLDIATTGWGFSSGSDASALIGHVGPPVDTNYVSADDAPPAPMQLELADLPPDITSVRFIVPVVRAAKIDGGDGNIQLALTPNGSNYDTGPDTPITTAFTYWGNATSPFVSHLNPATAAAWTPADFATGIDLRIDRTV